MLILYTFFFQFLVFPVNIFIFFPLIHLSFSWETALCNCFIFLSFCLLYSPLIHPLSSVSIIIFKITFSGITWINREEHLKSRDIETEKLLIAYKNIMDYYIYHPTNSYKSIFKEEIVK